MKKISPVVILSVVITLLLAGCVKSPSVSVKDELNIKPPIVEPPIVPPVASEPPVIKLRIQDKKVWESLGRSNSGDTYYNKKIVIKSPDILLVWTYTNSTDDNRKKRIEEVKKYDMEKSIKYQNYHHETVLWNIDCKNKRIKMEEFIDFDENGMVLDRYIYNHPNWEGITPQTGGEILYQKVCLPQKEPLKKKKKVKSHSNSPS